MKFCSHKLPTQTLLEAQLSSLSDLSFIFKLNVFSSSPMLIMFPVDLVDLVGHANHGDIWSLTCISVFDN